MQTVEYIVGCNFTVYKAKYFYPIYYPSWEMFFRESSWEEVKEASGDSYMIHVWNKLSKDTVVTVGSNQPYGKYASRYCEPVYLSAKPNF
jgi:lactosylceramide 4-alpha-galactosyltransferase